MGACCSGFGLNGNDNQKAKRRNSGFFLIEERPDTTTDEEKQKLKNNKNDKKSGAEADAGAPAGDARVFLRNCLLRGGIFTDEISFRQLTPEDVNRIVNNFEMKTFPTGTFLFHKGDYPCEVMHVAKRGLFRGVNGNIVKAIMKEGDLMGEIGFFHETPRLLSIMADNKGDCATYALHKWDWKVVAEKGRDLNSIRLLNDLTEEQKYQMKDKKELINMRAGQYLFKKGDEIADFYLVLSGIMQVSDASIEELEGNSVPWNGVEGDELVGGGGENEEGAADLNAGSGWLPTFLGFGGATDDIPPAQENGGESDSAYMANSTSILQILTQSMSFRGPAPEDETTSEIIVPPPPQSKPNDYVLIPGSYVGGEAMVLDKTTSEQHYLCIKETTLLKISKEFFNSEVFKTVRPLVSQELSLREGLRKAAKAEKDAPPKPRKLKKRQFDEKEDEEEVVEEASSGLNIFG